MVLRTLTLVLVLLALPVSAEFFDANSKKPEQLGGSPDILPVDEAFRFGYTHETGGTRVFWQILPGYYLYREKFRFSQGQEPIVVELAEGLPRNDEIFGKVQVFDGYMEVNLPKTLIEGEIQVEYQGCAAAGYCYPPQKRLINSLK